MRSSRAQHEGGAGGIPAAIAITALAVSGLIVAPSEPARSSSHMMGHITIERPGQLTADEAREVYAELAGKMANGYAGAGLEIVRGYQDWRRYSTAPYLSATHGNRYVHNYANSLARDYERVGEKEGITMPPGAVFAKDSFSLTDNDQIFPAPLFVMEKLEPGTSPQTADWRYVSILPDGTIFADTQGPSHDQAAFCHECHVSVAEADYLYYVPEEYRLAE